MSANQTPRIETGTPEQIKTRINNGDLFKTPGLQALRIPSGAQGTKQEWGQCFVARHALVSDVLAQPNHFHTGHYDRLMRALGTDLQVIAGPDDDRRRKMRHVLSVAMQSHTPHISGKPVSNADWLNQIAKAKSREVLAILADGPCREEPFNLVWEYGLLVPYLVFAEFLGTRFPVRIDAGARGAAFARNILGSDPPVRLQGVHGETWALVLWSQLFFAQLFVNFDNGAGVRTLAKYGLKKLEAYIHFWMKHPEALAPHGFLRAVLKANDAQPSQHKLNASDICAIFVELVGTALLLPGFAFCNFQSKLHDCCFEKETDINFDLFAAKIDPQTGSAAWQTDFDELFRLSPLTTQIDRVAQSVDGKSAEIGGVPIADGDRVTLLIETAARDPLIFNKLPTGKPVDPATFAPDPSRLYLEFRPQIAPRRCFGRDWSLGLLRQMMCTLAQYNVRPVEGDDGKLSKLLRAVPDRMMVHFKK